MHRINIAFQSLIVALLFAAHWGCNRSPYEIAAARGSVKIDGRPLTQAKVMFAPVDDGKSMNPGKPAFGILEADGSFVLSTYGTNDGAVVGEHWVTIIRLGKPTAQVFLAPAFTRLTLPKKVSVSADEPNEFDLTITSDDVKKFGAEIRD